MQSSHLEIQGMPKMVVTRHQNITWLQRQTEEQRKTPGTDRLQMVQLAKKQGGKILLSF